MLSYESKNGGRLGTVPEGIGMLNIGVLASGRGSNFQRGLSRNYWPQAVD